MRHSFKLWEALPAKNGLRPLAMASLIPSFWMLLLVGQRGRGDKKELAQYQFNNVRGEKNVQEPFSETIVI